jgi:hypothetical protein
LMENMSPKSSSVDRVISTALGSLWFILYYSNWTGVTKCWSRFLLLVTEYDLSFRGSLEEKEFNAMSSNLDRFFGDNYASTLGWYDRQC